MMKNQIDFGKGFKRIYFVLTGIYFIWLFARAVDFYDACAPHPGYTKYDYPIYCEDLTFMNQAIEILIMIAVPFVFYHFLKWIIKGFKKK